jgi:Prephenate dehydrogenase
MDDVTAGFIGFGLIGGSIARALKELNQNCKILAFNYYEGKANSSLEQALQDHTIDGICTSLTDGFQTCDIIFLCAPVLMNIAYLKQLKPIIKSSCILTDVGSVKGNIHDAVKELELEPQFVGGHPMAGSEKTGYHNSSSKLLENAYYILTPTNKTPVQMIQTLNLLVKDIGAIPVILDPYEHDDITAAISHVPHIIAASLVNMVRTCDNDTEKMRSLAAGGFKDITRIASSSPIMWQNICLTNTASIQKFLTIYRDSLDDFIHALDKGDEDYLLDSFKDAKDFRDSIPNKSIGIIEKIFEVYVDIIDEAGAIATIATVLASNAINIKNIGIIHNREFQEGVLRIELYDLEAANKTVDLLKHYRYTIYER